MKTLPTTPVFAAALAVLVAGCDTARDTAPTPVGPLTAEAAPHHMPDAIAGYTDFSPPVFDIAAAPDGSILVAENTTISQLRGGEVSHVIDIPSLAGTSVNGLEATGRMSFFATNSALDEAMGAKVWHVSQGRVRLVGDVEAFETDHDPDATFGPAWKTPQCEEPDFTAGPQSNPYHARARSGGELLVADAAGNTLLSARKSGEISLVAVFTPPEDENEDWRVLFPLDADTDCYVQPVPTSVDIGPDGDYYVGELTGAPSVPGWSRVWRIEGGSEGVVCPSDQCEEVLSGLTSVIDVAFGPDGYLYVVEFDEAGWLAAVTGAGVGGALKRCDVEAGTCDVIENGLITPGAITFDKRGNLWLLENGLGAPVVRIVELP